MHIALHHTQEIFLLPLCPVAISLSICWDGYKLCFAHEVLAAQSWVPAICDEVCLRLGLQRQFVACQSRQFVFVLYAKLKPINQRLGCRLSRVAVGVAILFDAPMRQYAIQHFQRFRCQRFFRPVCLCHYIRPRFAPP
jgi:hypothetical protein